MLPSPRQPLVPSRDSSGVLYGCSCFSDMENIFLVGLETETPLTCCVASEVSGVTLQRSVLKFEISSLN